MSCLLGLPKPMWVRTAIREGREVSARVLSHRQREKLFPVIAVFDPLGVPTVGFISLHHVFGEGQGGGAVDGDPVVIVGDDQLSQTEMTREGRSLGRHTFHDVAVAGEDPDVMVEDRELVAIEVVGEESLGDGHADALLRP